MILNVIIDIFQDYTSITNFHQPEKKALFLALIPLNLIIISSFEVVQLFVADSDLV